MRCGFGAAQAAEKKSPSSEPSTSDTVACTQGRSRTVRVAAQVKGAQQLHRLLRMQPASNSQRLCVTACVTAAGVLASQRSSMKRKSSGACAPAAGHHALLVDRQNGATAAEAVVGAAEDDAPQAQQRQRSRAHDARLAGHVQLGPARAGG